MSSKWKHTKSSNMLQRSPRLSALLSLSLNLCLLPGTMSLPQTNLRQKIAFQGLREADFSLRRSGWSLQSNDSQHQATKVLPNRKEQTDQGRYATYAASTACISSSSSSSSDSGKSRIATNPVPVAHGLFELILKASNIHLEPHLQSNALSTSLQGVL